VSVDYAAAPASASSDDYSSSAGTVSWAAGDGAAKTISIPITDDSATEGEESFGVNLSNPTGDAILGTPTAATVTIAASDPALQLGATSVSATEGGNATIEVTRVGPTAQAASVDYTSAPGSASEGDFSSGSGTVSWAAGDGVAKTITIPITDDTAAEREEAFTVSLGNPTGAALGIPTAATVTIAASDPITKPTLKLGGAKKQKLRNVRRKGVAITATVNKACRLDASVRKGKRRIGRVTRSLKTGRHSLRIKIAKKQRKRLRARGKLKLAATCSNTAGRSAVKKRTVTLKRG
jgi:hypothetical protein